MARENILLVDDEPDMRDALTAALRREGFCISTAANGVEALENVITGA
jgi:DNA-binding response OmpR family regulator